MKNGLTIPAKLLRAAALVWRHTRGWTVASFVLMIVQSVLPLLSLYLVKLIVDSATAAISAADKAAGFRQVAIYIGLGVLVSLLANFAQSFSGIVEEAQGQIMTDRVQDLLHAKSAEVDIEYYENSQYFDTLHRAQAEAPYRPLKIVKGLFKLGQSSLSLVALAGLLFSLHWGVAAVLLISAFPSVLLRVVFSRKFFRWSRERTAIERKAQLYGWILTSNECSKELRLFGFGPRFIDLFKSLRGRLRRERINFVKKKSGAEFAAQAVPVVAVAGAFAFLALRAIRGMITIGDLVMFYQAFQRGLGWVGDILGGLAGLYEDSLFLTNFYEFLDLEIKVKDPEQPRPFPERATEGIVFEDVSFRYPGNPEDALKEVRLHIRPGETIALVGQNGSGKTTLVKLLCRFYDPQSGRILLDGNDLREYRLADLRRGISAVFQDFVHYPLTVRENILLGSLEISGFEDSERRIIEAAGRSGADPVIKKLKKGYDTILGKAFEEGEEISIGEWQKIALARAFLRDARLIILDEPTSSLDARAEYEVFEKFRDLARGRSSVIISHRFSTVRMADSIYVLDRGRIIESGSHEQLISLRGTYAQLYELQARNFR